MSHPGDAIGKKDATEEDKPDASNFVDQGSPVSPLVSLRKVSFTNTSSSSSSSGSIAGGALLASANRSHSGELSGSTASSPTAGGSRTSTPGGHRRTGSGPLIYSGGRGGSSTTSSPAVNILPAGNICPSGKIVRTGMIPKVAPRSDVLGTGMANYGHGSIVRGGPSVERMRRAKGMGETSCDPEEAKRVGNDKYKKGEFLEALRMYDRAISMCPKNVACRSNRAAALMALGRLGEAVRECKEAVRLDPAYGRAHDRLASLYLRLGQVENAKEHLYFTGELPDPIESQKLQTVEKHLQGCADARGIGDWNGVLRESEAAITAGADSSLLLLASKAEAHLQLRQLEEADCVVSNTYRLETLAHTISYPKFFGMVSNSYVYFVRAQVDLALGRFENAELAAQRAQALDPEHREVALMLKSVKLVSHARKLGNELYNSGKFEDACLAYGEGLKSDPCNPVLYCNRAASYSKIGWWQKSVEDCTMALKYHPNYTKALLRRAASFGKLEKWAEAVGDYEVLRKELPQNKEVAESLFHAQIALKCSLGKAVANMTFGGKVEKIVDAEQFRTAISAPGGSIIYFMAPQNDQCLQISTFVDSLCERYPSLNFHKVNVEENRAVANMENVRVVPTIKFYRNGAKLKEMICPSQRVLENSVRHFVL